MASGIQGKYAQGMVSNRAPHIADDNCWIADVA